MGLEIVGHIDAGGAVRRADDGDAGGILELEAHQHRHTQGKKDTELGRRAKEHHLGVGEQGTKVDHGADADEQQQREQLRGDARLKQGLDGLRVDERQVHQNGAKTHGKQQGGLHLPLDGAPDQHAADQDHQALLPGEIADVAE